MPLRFYRFEEATRFRILRIYNQNNARMTIEFLRQVREHFPLAIQKIQTDNDLSFGSQFTWHLRNYRGKCFKLKGSGPKGIAHKHIPRECPAAHTAPPWHFQG
jgi:hypothetical protein